MHVRPNRYPNIRRSGVRRFATATFTASLVALLATIPTGSAAAGPKNPTPSVSLPASVSGLPVGEVEKLFAGIPLSDLNTAQLTAVLSKLPGLSTLPVGKLEEALTKVTKGLESKGGTLGQLLKPGEVVPTLETELKKLLSVPELLSLLGGENLTTKLTGALGSQNPSQLLGMLLSSSASPEQLLTHVLETSNQETVKTLLGTTLTGEPFSQTTVGGLASSLGTTTNALAEGLGTTLTSTTMALTAPLANGKLLGGVVNAVKGVTLGLLGGSASESKEKEANKETTKESSNNRENTKESGGPGTQGAGGATGAAGGASLVVNNTLGRQTAVAAKTVDKIEILSHKVKGRVATLVLQIPEAGNVVVSGGGVKAVRETARKRERLTVRMLLSKAGTASLHKRHNRLQVALKAAFKPISGSRSSATATVHFT